MAIFKHIQDLEPEVNDAFKEFYNTMLNDVKLGLFFKSQEQIDMLVEKQKEYFRASLSMNEETLKHMYVKLGEYHYDLRIPYVDFIKGGDILQEHFIIHSNKSSYSEELMKEVFYYFKIMKSYTAKGYLNRMIKEDQKDIELFFSENANQKNSYLPNEVILKKIHWLKDLLGHIEKSSTFSIEASEDLFENWINVSDYISTEKRKLYTEIEDRILIDAKNLIFFLGRGEYLEILPLYSSLLNIYKLTLILNNALTIEYANKVINQMKIDPMTGLFRKEIFEQLLKKELASLQRNPQRIFSVVYIDIDDFKKVNDDYGHYSGDKVIESLGKLINKNIRASDLGFRIGGDEFAIILKDADLNNSYNVAKKISEEFNELKFVFNDEIDFSSTLSMGIVEQNSQNVLSFDKIIKKVDDKLYISKTSGKNTISI